MTPADSRTDRRNWIDAALALWAFYGAWDAVRYFTGSRGRFHVESKLLILVAGCVVASLWGGSAGEMTPPRQQVLPTRAWLALLSVAAALVLYGPTLQIGLLSDDFVLVAEGHDGSGLMPQAGRFFRPLAVLVLTALAPSPAALHGANVALHGLNAFLVFRLARVLNAPGPCAFSAAALFLTFPAAVEAVGWCSGIQDVLMTTAGLLFVVAWGLEQPLWLRTVLALAALLLGIGSKETAVVFPALALATWSWSPRLPKREMLWLAGLTGCTAGIYAIWRLTAPDPIAGYARPLSRWMVKEMVVRTFGALAVPWHRDLGSAGIVLGATAGVLLPLLLVLRVRVWREDRAALGRAIRLAAWIVLSTAPVYGLLYVSPELSGSRYLYLAEAGWSILLAEMLVEGMRSIARGRIFVLAPVFACLAVSAVALRVHLRPWEEAAQLRDMVLGAAVRQMQALDCQHPTFEGLPDSIRGAYVFRNGFPEALRGASLHREGVEGSTCRLFWMGSAFEAR